MNWYKIAQGYDYASDLNSLLTKMAKLDEALTEKDWKTVAQQAWGYKDKFKNSDSLFNFIFGGDVYYLSDGGYSRVAINDETGKLFPTSNSLKKVVQNWDTPKAQMIIKDIEQDIAKLINAYETDDPEYTNVTEMMKD